MDMENWDRVEEILQTDFRYVRLQMDCTLQTVILIPKGDREFRVIVLIEVLWNSFGGFINQQIGTVVQLHDVLHGFQAGCGAGTASLEAKMLHNLKSMR